jgi:hypothetical protein
MRVDSFLTGALLRDFSVNDPDMQSAQFLQEARTTYPEGDPFYSVPLNLRSIQPYRPFHMSQAT